VVLVSTLIELFEPHRTASLRNSHHHRSAAIRKSALRAATNPAAVPKPSTKYLYDASAFAAGMSIASTAPPSPANELSAPLLDEKVRPMRSTRKAGRQAGHGGQSWGGLFVCDNVLPEKVFLASGKGKSNNREKIPLRTGPLPCSSSPRSFDSHLEIKIVLLGQSTPAFPRFPFKPLPAPSS